MQPALHQNQFDKIRILAALAVIFSHHFPLAGAPAPAWVANPWVHWAMFGGVAVMTFMCISGYLVTLSWYRKPQCAPFIWNRFLRVWPGMLASVLVCVGVFGLLFTTLSTPEFLSAPATWAFIRDNLTLYPSNATLPKVFAGQPYPEVMNGVYWTIPMEFMCYLILAALGLFGVLKYRRLASALGLLYIAWFLITCNADFTGVIRHWYEYPAYFAAGALIALHNDWFRQHSGKFLLIALPVLLGLYFFTPYRGTARFLLLPLLVIYLGNLPARDSWFTRLGDPSYGIYLYGYPIAQAVIALWPNLNFWLSLCLTFGLSLAAGYASWALLESRALRWKSLFSQRKPAHPVAQAL